MKKVFLVILSMCLIISMVGCGQKEPIEIQLTKENFDEYIILNVNINDFEIDSSRGVAYLLGYDSYEYTGIANLEVEARLKKDVKVNNVKISGRISTTGMCWAMKNFDFSLQLDKNGEGNISNQITTGDSSLAKPDRPTLFKFYNYSPSGNEFLINNDEVLITSLEGTVTVTERPEVSLPSATIANPDDSSSDNSNEDYSEFTKGSTINNVYTNKWANLKFELTGGFEEADASTYSASEAANAYCGLIAADQTAVKQISIVYEKLDGVNAFISEEKYIDIITGLLKDQFTQANYKFEFGETFDRTIANETYKSFIVTFPELNYLKQVNVRKQDSYIVLITADAKDTFNINTILNSITTAR